jgi:hypothetical protein
MAEGSKEGTKRGPSLFKDLIDRTLLSSIPFIAPSQLRSAVQKIFEQFLGGKEVQKVLKLFDAVDHPPKMGVERIASRELFFFCLSLALLLNQSTTAPADWPWAIRHAQQRLGLALPAPVLFADSNWSQNYFGFLVNPGTEQLEFWRTDYLALNPLPMSEWRTSLDGSHSQPWAVYTQPTEYISKTGRSSPLT